MLGVLRPGGETVNRTIRIALLASLAWHSPLQAQDRAVVSSDLRFETLRPGSSAVDMRGIGYDEGLAYSVEGNPLGGATALGIRLPVSERLTTLMETSHAEGGDLTSERSMLGQVGASLGGGWGLSAGLRHSELGLRQPHEGMPSALAGSADLGMFSVERSWNALRGSYTYYAGRADDGSSASGHMFRLHYFYGERNSVGLSYTLGPSLGLGPRETDYTDPRNMGITGEHWFTRRWAVNYNALVEDFGDGELKPELRLGLRMRF